jgi:cell wall-associated NlpC family hydrolase
MAAVTAGGWLPFTTHEPSDHDDDEEDEFVAPEPLFEGHEFPTWPLAPVPGNTQHDTPPKPPKAKKKAVVKPVHKHHEVKKVHPTPVADRPISIMLSFLRAQLGKPYVYGGNGPEAYDCSGLTVAAYARVGIHLPRTSEMQSGKGRLVSLSHLQVGDLLFWGSPAHHVAIYVGNGQFIGAQNPSTGVVIRSLSFDRPDYARRIL